MISYIASQISGDGGNPGNHDFMTSHDFPKVVQWGWPPLLNRTSGNDISQVHWGHSYPVTSAFTPRRDKIPADDPMKSTDEPGFRARLKWTSGSAVPHAVAVRREGGWPRKIRWKSSNHQLFHQCSHPISSTFSSTVSWNLIKSHQIHVNGMEFIGRRPPQLQVAWENPSVYTHAA